MEPIAINTPTYKLYLTKRDSRALKGIALLLLLFHHLFYIQNGLYDDLYIKGHGIIQTLGCTAKVCVALFVFLSGYGLSAVTENEKAFNWKYFFLHRFSKLYTNYWLIWLIFIPLGIFCFDISLQKVYGQECILPLLADLTGTLNLFGKYGYNPTWWFYSCIILLYISFPLILKFIKRKLTLCILILISVILFFCPFTCIQPIRYYFMIFLIGILIQKGLPPPSKMCNVLIIKTLAGNLTNKGKLVLIGVLLLTILLRTLMFGLIIDTFVAFLIVLVYKNFKLTSKINTFLLHLGKHSFNIFLFHTFIFYLYFERLVYWNRNPLIIFITLIMICLPISYLIEYIKKGKKFFSSFKS